MNRAQRRRLARAKPAGNRHDHARIPKIILQDRDFSQIDLLMLKLQKGEVETVNGEIVMTTMEGETYRVIPAMEGWLEFFPIPASVISSLATTQQIKMYLEPTTSQGEIA